MGEMVLVTGGGGFLGQYVVRQLLERGDSVRVVARGDYPVLRDLGAQTLRGDIRDISFMTEACSGIQMVHHTAALPGIWGRQEDFFSTNVGGTETVLGACRKNGVTRLVYTSSPSVIYSGGHISGLSEKQLPYPSSHNCIYSRTKAIAERMVLAADRSPVEGEGLLRTVALRPHLIWGPGDRNLIPRLVQRAGQGRLKIVGNGTNRVDVVYVENAAQAQLVASDALRDRPGQVSGKAFFITQQEPVELWPFINRILELAGVPAVTGRVPYPAAWLIGAGLEAVFRLAGKSTEPPMTRFLAQQLAKDHFFDIMAAKTELGYVPEISTEEGLARLGKWLEKSGRTE